MQFWFISHNSELRDRKSGEVAMTFFNFLFHDNKQASTHKTLLFETPHQFQSNLHGTVFIGNWKFCFIHTTRCQYKVQDPCCIGQKSLHLSQQVFHSFPKHLVLHLSLDLHFSSFSASSKGIRQRYAVFQQEIHKKNLPVLHSFSSVAVRNSGYFFSQGDSRIVLRALLEINQLSTSKMSFINITSLHAASGAPWETSCSFCSGRIG